MLFVVREQLLDPNGTVYSRSYTHQETFQEMKDLQSINPPFMNGTQFIAWSVRPFLSLELCMAMLMSSVRGAQTSLAVDVK